MITITKTGWLYIAITIFLGVAAVNTGNNLVFLIVSVLLGFMAVSGFFGRANISRLELAVEPPSEIFAGTIFPLRLTLRNERRFLPAFLLKVEVEGHAVLFPFIASSAHDSRICEVSVEQRGRHRIDALRLVSVFPFSFFVRSRDIATNVELVVCPQPKRCELASLFAMRRQSKDAEISQGFGHDVDLISVRDYMHGDPLKHISWKSTAKTGALKTKELSSPFAEPIIITVEQIPGSGLEERLSFATFAVIRLLGQGRPVGLKIGNRLHRPSTGAHHKASLLEELALYGDTAER